MRSAAYIVAVRTKALTWVEVFRSGNFSDAEAEFYRTQRKEGEENVRLEHRLHEVLMGPGTE